MNALIPSKGRHAKKQSALRKFIAATLLSITVVGNLTIVTAGAQALSVDASQAAFDFRFPVNGSLLSGGAETADGAVVKFSNITGTPIQGISIDAIVTNTLDSSDITNYDDNGNASSNTDYFQVNTDVNSAGGTSSFKFDFYEANSYTGPGTGTPVVLNNVSITSIDIDGSNNFCQFTDFTGFQSYVLASSTTVDVKTNATDPTVPVGTTRFLATSCTNNSNRVNDAVQVQFDSVTSFTAKFGTDRTSSPNYFGVAFKPMSAMFAGALAAPVENPSNQPPTSNDTTRYVTNSEPSIIQLADFGNYQDPDNNPFTKVQISTLPAAGTLEKFVNGAWVAVSLNDEIAVSEITNGNLRFTGSVDRSLQFKVFDGVVYSTSAYTLSLLMSDQGQEITFTNPGTKAPTDPAFASGATSNSGLPVTLTSLTPGVCTVSGTDITPVSSGLCTIVATQPGDRTYSAAAPVSQTFPISTLTPQTITAPSPGDQTYSGSSYTVTLSPTATSGLTVTMISESPAVCTVSGFVVTIVGPGNCTIRNTQGGNGTYAPAPEVEYTFVVASPAASYTITYDDNGSDGGSVPAVQTGSGSKTLATNSGTLAKTNFTFTGWNTAADGSGTHYDVSATYNLTADVTLYAEWTAVAVSYTITYDDNGSDSGSVPAVQTGSGSKTLATNSGTLAKTNFTFTGWNTAADGSGTHYDVSATYNLTANVTLYAEWTLTPQVIYNPNGATDGTVPESVEQGSPVVIDPNTGMLTRAGFRFVGWNTAADGSGQSFAPGETPNLPIGTVLYAQWEPEQELAFTGSELNLPLGFLGAFALLFGFVLVARSATRKS
jgi:uncharacterized repeat protein (TIGR02543 family)